MHFFESFLLISLTLQFYFQELVFFFQLNDDVFQLSEIYHLISTFHCDLLVQLIELLLKQFFLCRNLLAQFCCRLKFSDQFMDRFVLLVKFLFLFCQLLLANLNVKFQLLIFVLKFSHLGDVVLFSQDKIPKLHLFFFMLKLHLLCTLSQVRFLRAVLALNLLDEFRLLQELGL